MNSFIINNLHFCLMELAYDGVRKKSSIYLHERFDPSLYAWPKYQSLMTNCDKIKVLLLDERVKIRTHVGNIIFTLVEISYDSTDRWEQLSLTQLGTSSI